MFDPKDPIPQHPERMAPGQVLATCQRCRATCCTYMATEIDAPTTLADFENIRWHCAHKAVWVFKQGSSWYIAFDAVCEKLQADYTCGIYDKRPQVCRDHKFGECDYFLRGEFDVELRSLEAVDAYLRKRFPSHYRHEKQPARPRRRAPGGGGAAGGE
jgi:Fe-S-cluster containining protein